ncbi:MAG: hypothetical protein Q8O39_01345 [bacterium]|nr:hypothetical protein [bacterium]
MKTGAKKLIFCVFLVLFFIFAPIVIFYSLGYRFDFQNKKLVQTGGIYVKTQPKKAKVFLNEEFVNFTDFLGGSFFIKNLLPGNYSLEIQNDGYGSWSKNLLVEEKMVTEVKEVILLPNEIPSLILDQKVIDFYSSPSLKKMLVLKNDEKGANFYLNEIDENPKKLTASAEFFFNINSSFKKINGVFWNENEEKIIINSDKGFYLLEKIGNKKSKLILNPNIKIVGFASENKISYLDANGVLVIYNLEDLTSEMIKTKNKDCIWKNGSFLCLDIEGFAEKIGIDGKTQKVFNLEPLSISDKKIYEIIAKSNKIFVQENNALWLLDQKNIFEKIEINSGFISPAPDNKKIAIFQKENPEISLFYLEKDYQQPIKESGQKNKIIKQKDVSNIFWFDPYHLFIQKPDKITFIETDNKGKINQFEVFNKPIKKAVYDEKKKAFYILDSKNYQLLVLFFSF